MIVYYRMCGLPSTNPSPVFQEDKFKLNELCLKSFREAFREINPTMVFINDFCDSRYFNLINDIVPFKHVIYPTEIGINNTCLMQYDLAKEQDEDILFAECDYLWKEQSGQILLKGLDAFGLVSPYDNLNFYLDPSIHSDRVSLKLVEEYHWRSVERITMTFAVKNEIFKKNYEIFKKYGYLDNDVWREMEAQGFVIYTPIPSLATHMVKDFMAPGINWKTEWEKYLQ